VELDDAGAGQVQLAMHLLIFAARLTQRQQLL
jgi:hypothetical protein